MSSYLPQFVVAERIADQRRAAERHHVAAVAANGTRRERSPRLPHLRANRSVLRLRKRVNPA
jgi:hypothetical protein